ncbi:LysR family transcriptional regulator [Salinisphaera orenii]|uniref:LysR family transcriptional regulator n=1 Tax=Salinisphaera orenii TaxID=856731 RepID=UPI000DBE51B5
MIERIHLNILREVNREGSLTAAAGALHLTQSAVSHSIRKLENQCGARMWSRDGRQVRLTPVGEYVLASAERLLPQLERVDEVVAEYAAGDRGNLRIGMECHPCYRWLLKVVEPYLAEWPGVDLDVMQQFQFGGMAALFNHEIDILVTPDPLQCRGVLFEPVFAYEQVLAVGSQHRLAQRERVEADDLRDEVLLSYPVDATRLDVFTQVLVPANVSPKKHKTVESTDIMLELIAAGRGVAALPRWLIDEYAETHAIQPVRFGDNGIAKQIYLGVRSAERDQQHLNAFLEMAQAL